MSLLRRLTEQAQQVKDAEAAQERGRADRKERFAQITVPAMQALGAFLTELTDQLKVVRPPVQATYDIPGYGSFPAACLFDFAVRVEPRYSDVIVELSWKSRIDTERAPRLMLNSFDRIRNLSEIFKRLHLGGFKDEKRGPGGHVIACSLQATGFINSRMQVVATLEDEVARFAFENVDQLVSTRQSIPVSVLSDEVCERLGEFLLRDNDIFIRDQWVRGLSPPAKPFRPVNLEERAVVALNSAAPMATTQSGGAVGLNIESGFSRASAQRQDRDNALLAELSEASRMAEEVVKQTIATGPLAGYSEERSLGSVLSSSAGLADMHRQQTVATPPVQPAPPQPVAAQTPVAPATPRPAATTAPQPPIAAPAAVAPAPPVVATPAPRPAAPASVPSPPPVRPAAATPAPSVATRPVAPPAPAPIAARPAAPAPAPTAAAPARSAAATPAAHIATPARPVVPATAPPVPVKPPAPTVTAPAAAKPWAPAAPVKPTAPVVATPPQPAPVQDNAAHEAQPAVARSFMDRFQKMRSELERKP